MIAACSEHEKLMKAQLHFLFRLDRPWNFQRAVVFYVLPRAVVAQEGGGSRRKLFQFRTRTGSKEKRKRENNFHTICKRYEKSNRHAKRVGRRWEGEKRKLSCLLKSRTPLLATNKFKPCSLHVKAAIWNKYRKKPNVRGAKPCNMRNGREHNFLLNITVRTNFQVTHYVFRDQKANVGWEALNAFRCCFTLCAPSEHELFRFARTRKLRLIGFA